MRKVISREDGIKLMIQSGRLELKREVLPITEALDRRSASSIEAPFDIPQFSRSTRDGYAVNHLDVKGVSEGTPAYLNLVGEVKVGELPKVSIALGETVRVFTGSYLPEGSDAVVMDEFAEEDQGVVEIYRSVSAGENVFAKGEDCQKGTLILGYGEKITLGKIGLLSAYGLVKVEVIRLRVGIISTGDEIVSPGISLPPGKIYDVNSFTLYALLKKWGADPWIYGVVPDNLNDLISAMKTSLEESDLVILSGGSSIGARDFTKEVFRKLDGELMIEGLNISPGRPTIAGWIRNKPVFGLPGHPVSSLVAARVFLLPTLERMLGLSNERPIFAPIVTNLPSDVGVEEFICASWGEKGVVPIWGKSGAISRIEKGGLLIRIPEGIEGYKEGEVVEVWSI